MQRAAATQPEHLAFRRPDVPADSKTSYSDQQHRANTQSFRPSDALAAAGQPRSPLEQVTLAELLPLRIRNVLEPHYCRAVLAASIPESDRLQLQAHDENAPEGTSQRH